MEQDERTAEIMRTLRGVPHAEVPADLRAKIAQTIGQRKQQLRQIPTPWLVATGLAACLLIALNLLALKQSAEKSPEPPFLQDSFNLYQ